MGRNTIAMFINVEELAGKLNEKKKYFFYFQIKKIEYLQDIGK